jgi:peroxiredoxin Q/BCP
VSAGAPLRLHGGGESPREARDFEAAIADFRRAGAEILGASKDTVEKLQQFRAHEGLTFPLLSDAENDVCERYGVWEEKSNYGRKYLGIERTTFVIDEEGRIARTYPKVKVEGHAEEVLAAVQAG